MIAQHMSPDVHVGRAERHEIYDVICLRLFTRLAGKCQGLLLLAVSWSCNVAGIASWSDLSARVRTSDADSGPAIVKLQDFDVSLALICHDCRADLTEADTMSPAGSSQT